MSLSLFFLPYLLKSKVFHFLKYNEDKKGRKGFYTEGRLSFPPNGVETRTGSELTTTYQYSCLPFGEGIMFTPDFNKCSEGKKVYSNRP